MKEFSPITKDFNPQDSCNFLSKIFFSYLDKTFIKAYKHYLTEEDLFANRQCDNANHVSETLNQCWENQLERSKRLKGALNKAIAYMTFGPIMKIIMLPFIEETLKLGQAIVLGQLLRYFSGELSTGMAYFYAILLALCCFLPAICHHNSFYHLQALGMRIRVAASSMLYQKFLLLSTADFGEISSGKAVNLFSNDVMRYDFLFMFSPYFVIAPYQLLIVTIYCWIVIGWYAIVGISLLIIFAGILMTTPRAYRYLRKTTALVTDERLLHMNELLNAVKVIKASCWEDHFLQTINAIRRKEIVKVLWSRFLEGGPPSIASVFIKLTIFAIICTYLLVESSMPNSSNMYSVITAIAATRVTILLLVPFALRMISESWISSRRIEDVLCLPNKFPKNFTRWLNKPKKLTHSEDRKVSMTGSTIESDEKPYILTASNLTLQWNKLTPITDLEGLNLQIRQGSLVAVVGSVGSGKSSFLLAMMNEMFEVSGSLQLSGNLSYSSQDPWLFNGTLRQNVIFGSAFSKPKLNRVYRVTCLNQDLKQFKEGDRIFLGDKGVGLSGGQRARVSLARAIYRDADLYLLDEPLGALDVKTRETVFYSCIKEFLSNKTRILVTHQVQILNQCDWIVILNKGSIVDQGTFAELTAKGIDFSIFKEPAEKEKDDRTEEFEDALPIIRSRTVSELAFSTDPADKKHEYFTPQESIKRGDVGLSVYLRFFHAGARLWFNVLLVLGLIAGTVVLFVLTDWWLAAWLREADTQNASHSNSSLSSDNLYYLKGFVGLTMGSFALCLIRIVAYVLCVVNSSRILHNEMFGRILRAPLYFFSITPMGVILNRFSKDVGAMDDVIPSMLQDSLECGMIVIGLLVYIAIVNPYTLIVIVPYIGIALFLRRVYMKCGQEVKRLEAVTRTPIYAHLNNTLQGIPTVRAFQMEQTLLNEFNEHLDHNTKAFNLFLTTQKWFQLRLEIVSSLFVLLSTFIFIGLNKQLNIPAPVAGLSISYAVTMLGLFQWAVRQSAELASYMTSVERVLEYSELDPEINPVKPVKVPEDWTRSARLEVANMSFKYGPDTDVVLRGVNFTIEHGTKVGIVGRTGAVKSSIFNALLRLGHTSGEVILDGVDTSAISLSELRSHVALIPQEPVFFTCTLRQNLDPFGKRTDEEVWSALEKVKMGEEIERQPLGLDMRISEGGSNISVGQRQLLCLARAILRQSSLLLIDEATANVDRETDLLVQAMIRQNFQDCTILTIAHRLDTIVDSDIVMVFDQGELREIGRPFELLTNKQSLFWKLASEAGNSELLRLTELASNVNKSED